MKDRDRFIKLCLKGMQDRGVIQDERYKNRLLTEVKEIDAQAEHEYLLNLYDKFRSEKLIFPENENNLLVDWLLGLTNEFNIDEPSKHVQGESPDIDIDYLKDVRDYLKRTWASETFGQENVCEIGTYGTIGIKSAMLDMAKVHDADKSRVQAITVSMNDKDEDGKTLEWDRALQIYPELANYCRDYPEVASAAKLMIDRNKNGGVHAGGLIISSKRIDGFVPLEVRMVNKQHPNGVVCSAWTEGLSAQDLQPVGLIKFDLLVINNLMQIAIASRLVKERHGLTQICAAPGQWDWSDVSYLNDPEAIAMANRADLKCIFQFDSEGIRKLVKRGGVNCFDDLAAFSALYRPGPLNMLMDVKYCRRKKWAINPDDPDGEPYELHPAIQPILGVTYGVMCYQEQVMDILRVVGKIPDMHTEKVRKAISKKKVAQFIKYKEQFVQNGQEVLSQTKDFVENLWQQIESFAEYGFNKSVLKSTIIPHKHGLKKIEEFVPGDVVYCIDQSGNKVETEVVKLHDHGVIEGFEVTFDDGYKITCSAEHKFLTENGQVSLREICRTRSSVMCSQEGEKNIAVKDITEVEHGVFPFIDGEDEVGDLGLGAGHAPITDTGNLVSRKVVRVVSVGKCHMFDLEVANPTHNFILPNGVVTSNSHAYAYTYISSRLLWLKAHYPLEFYAAILMCEKDEDKLKEYKLDAMRHGVEVLPVHINHSKENFHIENGKIYFGFSNIKGLGEEVAERIVSHQPYKSFIDFLDRFGADAKVLRPLIALGVFEEHQDRVTLRKFTDHYREVQTRVDGRNKRFAISMEKKSDELKALLLEQGVLESDSEFPIMNSFTSEAEEKWAERFSGINKTVEYKVKGAVKHKEVSVLHILQNIARKRRDLEISFLKKTSLDDVDPLDLDKFNPAIVKLKDEDMQLLTNERRCKGTVSYPDAERTYYGFEWVHELETCPAYLGNTLDKFLEEADIGNLLVGMVEVKIIAVRRRTSKKNTVFYSVDIEDANGKQMVVNVWEDDYDRWKAELVKGNLVKMRVRPPSGGFNTLTFDSVSKRERYKLPPKEQDHRLVVMESVVEVPQATEEELSFIFDAGAVEGLDL